MQVAKLVTSLVLVAVAGIASADDGYTTAYVDQKVKQNSSTGEYHNVYGMTFGLKVGGGFATELNVEEEQVLKGSSGESHQGLFQVGLRKSFETGTMFTPYVFAGVGVKNKETIDFPEYRYDIGAVAKINDNLSAKLNWRHRQAWDATISNGTATKFDTDETRIGVTYKVTKVDALTVSYAQERHRDGVSSEYNTTGLSYTRSF